MTFPRDFTWGVAAAAYQVEGAAAEDGKGPSVWDMMCTKEKAIWNGQSGAVACDHYHRYASDVALMKDLGVRAYRLSTAWARILPDGTGAVNAKGLDFYNRLVDALLAAGIEPWVTLFHWDFPLALYRRGGWLNRDSADWFAEYAQIVAQALGDRVTHWMTHNEPQCTIGLGHRDGVHAPGDRLAAREWLQAGHHLLLSHGRGVQALRAHSPRPCQIGYAPVGACAVPATGSAADIAAARAFTYSVPRKDTWSSTWWIDPVLLGRYPADGWALYGADVPVVRPGDLETIRQPLDFLGLNIYHAPSVRAGADGKPETVPEPLGHALTTFSWPIVPSSLYWGPKFLYERYKLPLAITENGMANVDWIALDGKVHDPQRIDFLTRYLRELRRACADGVDLRGYFVWSVMDNFEWAEGFKQRFGLVYVDYATQRRVPKDSAYWYKGVIESNGASLAD